MSHSTPLSNRAYALGVARAFAGAIIFGLPLLMTMEMWALGSTTHPLRLLLFLLVNFAVLVILSRFGGFEPTSDIVEDVLDALAAYAVGIVTSAAILTLFGLFQVSMSASEIVGMVAVQAVPASFGAMLARKQLSTGAEAEQDSDEEREASSYGYEAQLFLMLAGALFLAFNVAPTEEIVLISLKMSAVQSLLLMGFSLIVLHLLVFSVGLAGQAERPEGYGAVRVFLAFTVPGYAIALAISFYILWTFGSVEACSVEAIAGAMVVLGFPAAVGAAIARLVI